MAVVAAEQPAGWTRQWNGTGSGRPTTPKEPTSRPRDERETRSRGEGLRKSRLQMYYEVTAGVTSALADGGRSTSTSVGEMRELPQGQVIATTSKTRAYQRH